MKWIYLAGWAALTARDVPRLWRAQEWKALGVWLALAVSGLALAVWYFWGGTDWRLADWACAVMERK